MRNEKVYEVWTAASNASWMLFARTLPEFDSLKFSQ